MFARSWGSIARILVSIALAAPGLLHALNAPELDPPGETGWVGSTTFRFKNPSGSSFLTSIYYTLDGSAPQTSGFGSSTKTYTPGTSITLNASTTVRAIAVQGFETSRETRGVFTRAKVSTPVARFGGSARFSPVLPCTLSVSSPPNAVIRYTLNNSNMGSASTYANPLKLDATTKLRAFATYSGYDNSDTLVQDFTLEPVATPIIDPSSRSFASPSLTLWVSSATKGAHIYLTDNPKLKNEDWKNWTLMTGDSISLPAGEDGDSIVVRARAVVGDYQISEVKTETYRYLPAVAAPVLDPASRTFYDTLYVNLSTATLGASIRYTDDSVSNPTQSSLDSNPVLLIKSTLLKARAFKDQHDPSPVTTGSYTMRLSKPGVDKPDQEFTDKIAIRLSRVNPEAKIYYSLNRKPPTYANGKVDNGVLFHPDSVIMLGEDTNVVKAIAVAFGVASDVAEYTYTKTSVISSYAVPSVSPTSKEFEGELLLYPSSNDPDAVVRCALSSAGRDPTPADPVVAAGEAIRLDSSAELRCRAYPRDGASNPLQPSNIRKETYKLRPSSPTASVSPAAPVPAGTVVTLKTRTKNGVIHYSTEAGTDLATTQGFPDSVNIRLDRTTFIYAVTILGTGANALISPLLFLRYDVVPAGASDTLPPGETRTVAGGFTFGNETGLSVVAKVSTPDKLELSGFSEVSLVLTLEGTSPGQSMKVAFSKPSGTRAALYRVTEGRIEFVTGAESAILTRPGAYFLGVDIAPPVITLVKQVPKTDDSTTVKLRVTDNVAGPACEIASPGVKGGRISRPLDDSGMVSVNLKGKAGEVKALWMRAIARDAFDSAGLPAEPGGKIFVSQLWSTIATPKVLTIGQGAGQQVWDLAGFPVGAGAGLMWKDVRALNPDLEGYVLKGAAGSSETYGPIQDTATIGQGMAFWAGSLKPVSSLNLPRLRSGESEPDGSYRIAIKPGWNLITNPSLERAYWPITPKQSLDGGTRLKTLNRFVHGGSSPYAKTDTLEPWIGYFAYYSGFDDTTVTIYPTPAARAAALAKGTAAAKQAASAGAGGQGMAQPPLRLTLSADGAAPIHLGARSEAADDFGPEDEPRLPPWQGAPSVWSQRGGHRLATDWTGLAAGKAAHWRIIVDPGAFQVRQPVVTLSEWPPGFEAWAVSKARGLKSRLESGQAIAVPGTSPDTLDIYAGPQSALAELKALSQAPETVGTFSVSLVKIRGNAQLRLDLPWAGAVRIEATTLSGRRVAGVRRGSLPPGQYRFPLASNLPAQHLILRVRYDGPAGGRELIRKISQ